METNKQTLADLNEKLRIAKDADKKIVAEQMSNILLVAGKHYHKIANGIRERLRDANLSETQKLRLTKNHIQKITGDIKDILLSQCSSLNPVPRVDAEQASLKAAELTRAVWEWSKDQLSWEDLVDSFVNSFVDVGEVAAKVFFDPSLGDLKGYQQKIDDEGRAIYLDAEGNETYEAIGIIQTTEDQVNEFGEPITIPISTEIEHEAAPDTTKPIFTGQVVVEKLFPFNLYRDPGAATFKESPYLIVDRMINVNKAIELFGNNDEDLIKTIKSASKSTYKLFNAINGAFEESKDQVNIIEHYYRKCTKYPHGYYYIHIDSEILDEGELPFGEDGEIAFPIKVAGYDMIETSCRFSSPIRPLRPYQLEINRAASSKAETSIALGADKVIIKNGGTVSKGATLPGMRVLKVTGPDPVILPGRDGSQYSDILESNIREMYHIARIPENQSADNKASDPEADLFKSAKQKSRFVRQAGRLERFILAVGETVMFLQQKHLDETQLIPMVGKKEFVNIPEFKNVNRLDRVIKVEPVSGDFQTMYGKLIELRTIAQYLGADMPMDVKAKLIKSFPTLSKDPAFKQFLVEYESPQNMTLALDRGEDFVPSKYDNAKEMLRALYLRCRQSDFKFLDQTIQENYASTITEYEDIEAKQVQELINKQNGFIPTGGNMVKCDFYVEKLNKDGTPRQERALLPSELIQWAIDYMNQKGLAQTRLEELAVARGQIDILDKALGPQQTAMSPQVNQNIPIAS